MIKIDNNNPKAIYEQIYDEIVRLIMSKVFKPNDKLPSVRELASMTKINPNTIQKAYKYLEDDNYIYSIKGVGNFVKDAEELRNLHMRNLKEELYKIIKSLKELGLTKDELIKIVNEFIEPGIEGGESNVGSK
ncbi:MAG TPA: GntR family transcriptional regulator [Tissierellia bacterium]|nr:GntR family transcriptional regulator [Tissierellia bacterium]